MGESILGDSGEPNGVTGSLVDGCKRVRVRRRWKGGNKGQGREGCWSENRGRSHNARNADNL